MRDGPFKAGNAHRVVPAETSEKCRDGSQQTKLRSSSERGPAGVWPGKPGEVLRGRDLGWGCSERH